MREPIASGSFTFSTAGGTAPLLVVEEELAGNDVVRGMDIDPSERAIRVALHERLDRRGQGLARIGGSLLSLPREDEGGLVQRRPQRQKERGPAEHLLPAPCQGVLVDEAVQDVVADERAERMSHEEDAVVLPVRYGPRSRQVDGAGSLRHATLNLLRRSENRSSALGEM